MLAFLIYGTQDVFLQMAWSGFRSPNGFYCRMTWLAIFVLVWMAAWTLKALADMPTKASGLSGVLPLAAGVALVAALLCVARLLAGFDSLYAMAYMGASACILAACAWISTREGQNAQADVPSLQYASSAPEAPDTPRHFAASAAAPPRSSALCVACYALLCLLPTVELIWCAHATMEQIYVDYQQSYHDAYIAESSAQLAELPEGGTGAFRVDKTYNRMGATGLNEGMALGYHALSSYCSSQNGTAVAFLAQMGYTQENTFSMRYARPSPLMDSLLGLRYVSTDVQWPGLEDKGFTTA
ncbi:MAG: YfhO family protein, partial [Coriobacteriales bacterium]|nr:YfhO family protein [Coriobacteriales bacterium]